MSAEAIYNETTGNRQRSMPLLSTWAQNFENNKKQHMKYMKYNIQLQSKQY